MKSGSFGRYKGVKRASAGYYGSVYIVYTYIQYVCVPEWSSLTSDDTVLVMESAATRRSFLRFLLGPETERCEKKKTIIN